MENPNSWNLMGYFCPKNAFVQKIQSFKAKTYTSIYLTLLSTTCENSPNYLCHFWNHKPFFLTQLLCIFLAQTLNTFYEVQIFRLSISQVKVHQRVHQCTIFQIFECSMKVHRIPHAISETIGTGFIQILHQCSVSWKITPLYRSGSNLIYFWQK